MSAAESAEPRAKNYYTQEYKNYLNTYVSPTFRSTPIFKPEETPPLYRNNIDYNYHQRTNLPHLAKDIFLQETDKFEFVGSKYTIFRLNIICIRIN